MSVIHSPKKPIYDARLLFLPVVLSTLALVLISRLWYIQVAMGPELQKQALNTNQSTISRLAPRGLIYDRNGVLIAAVQSELVVMAVPQEVKKNPELLDEVAQLLGVDAQDLRIKLKKGTWRPKIPVPIYVNASIHQATKISESLENLPGISVQSQPMRYYPDPMDYTHILGNVWVPDKSDLKRMTAMNLEPSEYVGKSGVEWFYEKELMGKPGTDLMEVDKKNQPLRIISRDSPIPGAQLNLSLDARLQKIATEDLKGKIGAVVAIDPNNGEVLCMVSAPTYSLDLFDGGISTKNYRALADSPDKPFQNRAVNGFYAPGSTFKVITSTAMQRTGNLNLNEYVYCNGGYRMGKAIIRCLENHGSISYENAFAQSCNTYFCTMGVRSGPSSIQSAAVDYGFGVKSGIDLRTEYNQGVVPTEAYANKVRHGGGWHVGDTANMAIGQGFVLASPIQLAQMTAMVATEGTQYVPHLVHSIRESEKSPSLVQPVVERTINMPTDFWDHLRNAMRMVIDNGTAQSAKIAGLEWGGKTGSSEHGKGKTTHGWFIGMAPLDHPQIVIAVIVESGGHGGSVAAPIARDVVRAYLKPLNVAKDLPKASKSSLVSSKSAGLRAGVR